MTGRKPTQENRLRFFNDVVYEAFPAEYNALDRLTFGAWWQLVRRALDYVPEGGRVLEIGFGPGRLHVELARRVEQCVGLDLAWGMCRFTKRRMHRGETYPGHRRSEARAARDLRFTIESYVELAGS